MDKKPKKVDRKRFVRYKEGAEMYSMCQSKFENMAKDAGVRFKDENIVELTAHCNEDTIKQVVFMSKLLLTEESLEERSHIRQ